MVCTRYLFQVVCLMSFYQLRRRIDSQKRFWVGDVKVLVGRIGHDPPLPARPPHADELALLIWSPRVMPCVHTMLWRCSCAELRSEALRLWSFEGSARRSRKRRSHRVSSEQTQKTIRPSQARFLSLVCEVPRDGWCV